MQAPFEEDRTWQSAMARLSNEGEMQRPIVSSRVRPMCGKGNFSKCAIRILERNGQISATIAWSDATSCCYGEQTMAALHREESRGLRTERPDHCNRRCRVSTQAWPTCPTKRRSDDSGYRHGRYPRGGNGLTGQIRLFVNNDDVMLGRRISYLRNPNLVPVSCRNSISVERQ